MNYDTFTTIYPPEIAINSDSIAYNQQNKKPLETGYSPF